jgi:hypothetical protein
LHCCRGGNSRSPLILGPAAAQRVPTPDVAESILKRNLMTFNDANITGNYEVMHARSAKQLQAKFTPAQLKEAFKFFRDEQIDIMPVLAMKPVYSKAPAIDNEGALVLDGHFETRPSRVRFNLRLLPAEGDWKMLGINVNVSAADGAQSVQKGQPQKK